MTNVTAGGPVSEVASRKAILEGRFVDLVALFPQDLKALYGMVNDIEIAHQWRHQGFPPPEDVFMNQFLRSSLMVLGLRSRSGMNLVGFVSAIAADFRHGHCQVAAMAQRGTRGRGYGAEGAILMIDFIFGSWPFRIVYCEIPEYNFESTYGTMTRQIRPFMELTLRGTRTWAGREWNTEILALHRDQWLAIRHTWYRGSILTAGEQ